MLLAKVLGLDFWAFPTHPSSVTMRWGLQCPGWSVPGHVTLKSQRGKGGSSPVLRGKEMEEVLEEHQVVETKRWGGQFAPGHGVRES